QLLDGVAAVTQDAGVAVELGDRTRAGGRGHEARVVEPDVGEQLAPFGGVDASVDDRDLDRLAAAVVGDRDGFRHGSDDTPVVVDLPRCEPTKLVGWRPWLSEAKTHRARERQRAER